MKVYFDGADFLEKKVLVKQKEWSSFVAKEGWSRISMPIHIALETIRTVCCQAIRGTTSICAGIFTLRGGKIVAGLKDYLSLLIQAVALPVIGIVATFHPKTGLTLLQKLTKYHLDYKEVRSTRTYVKIVESFFRGIGGVPSSFISLSTRSVSYLLRGKVKKAGGHILGALVLPVASFAGIFAGGWVNRLYEGTHECCDIDKFDPPYTYVASAPLPSTYTFDRENDDPLNGE